MTETAPMPRRQVLEVLWRYGFYVGVPIAVLQRSLRLPPGRRPTSSGVLTIPMVLGVMLSSMRKEGAVA